jgi:hypothetical protein
MSFLFAIERRYGREDSAEVGRRQLTGIAGLTSERLRDALGLDTSMAALAQVLELHPLLSPRGWVAASVSFDEPGDEVRLAVSPSAALDETHLNWIQLMVDGHDGALDAAVQGVDLHYSVERIEPSDGEVAAWRVVRTEEPAHESQYVRLTRFSTGADFRFSETPVELGRS